MKYIAFLTLACLGSAFSSGKDPYDELSTKTQQELAKELQVLNTQNLKQARIDLHEVRYLFKCAELNTQKTDFGFAQNWAKIIQSPLITQRIKGFSNLPELQMAQAFYLMHQGLMNHENEIKDSQNSYLQRTLNQGVFFITQDTTAAKALTQQEHKLCLELSAYQGTCYAVWNPNDGPLTAFEHLSPIFQQDLKQTKDYTKAVKHRLFFTLVANLAYGTAVNDGAKTPQQIFAQLNGIQDLKPHLSQIDQKLLSDETYQTISGIQEIRFGYMMRKFKPTKYVEEKPTLSKIQMSFDGQAPQDIGKAIIAAFDESYQKELNMYSFAEALHKRGFRPARSEEYEALILTIKQQRAQQYGQQDDQTQQAILLSSFESVVKNKEDEEIFLQIQQIELAAQQQAQQEKDRKAQQEKDQKAQQQNQPRQLSDNQLRQARLKALEGKKDLFPAKK